MVWNKKTALKRSLENKRARRNKSTLPSSSIDLNFVEVSQDVAERSVCVYGSMNNTKWVKNLQKCGNIDKLVEERGGLVVTYSSKSEAQAAVAKLHGHEGATVCLDFAPPLLVATHNSDIFAIRDVPDDVTIPELWSSLGCDELNVSHMSLLCSSSHHVIIVCKDKTGQQALKEKSGTRLGNWRLKVELWFEFCFHMTRQNLLLIENLPDGSTVDSVKVLIGVSDGVEYVEVVESLHCALVYCKSKSTVTQITERGEENLRISLYDKVVGYRYMAFVDNLHETTKETDLISHFKDSGNILKVTLKLDQKSGLKRAVVYFERESSISSALKKDGSDLLGHSISVKSSLKPLNTVFITNLHRGATKLQLCLIFQDCGHIESVELPNQKNTVLHRKAAIVVFKDTGSVPKALAKNNKDKIRGLRILVHDKDPYERRGSRKRSHPVSAEVKCSSSKKQNFSNAQGN